MHNYRWCIIGGTRSGSTWLEEILWSSAKKLPNNIKLGEFILPRIAGEFKLNYRLDDNKHLVETDVEETFKDVDDFFEQRTTMLFNCDTKQPISLRVFCQNWEYPDFSYIDFFKTLEKRNFTFLSLYRNLFDRTTSWYFMERTGRIHRWYDWWKTQGALEVYSTVEGNLKPYALPLEKTYVDISDWSRIFLMAYNEEVARLEMTKDLGCIEINYDRLILDCIKNKLPIYPKSSIKKTYNELYEDVIENYDEVKEAYFELVDSLGIINDKFK
jgi:hypothetical protein